MDAVQFVHCLLQYLDQSGLRISRAEFEANFATKLADSAFAQDVAPLLGPRTEWNIEGAAAMCATSWSRAYRAGRGKEEFSDRDSAEENGSR